MTGSVSDERASRSSRMMTSVTPEGPRFFCAPEYISPKRLTSTGPLNTSEEVSATSGTSPTSGRIFHWVPSIVLLLVMWAYADPDDVAEAHVLALQAELTGHEAFMLAQPITRFKEPTTELIELNFGPGMELRGELKGNASVISAEKARRTLGWRPRAGWSES